ncbi:MAG: hypothetical protein WED33_06210 [Bacteroidia bacterium]
MKQIKLKISSLFLISSLLFPQDSSTVKGCGGGDLGDIIDLSMFIPEIVESDKYDSFFLSIWDYYSPYEVKIPGRPSTSAKTKNELNIEEWKTYFIGLSDEKINDLVYKYSETFTDSLIKSASGKFIDQYSNEELYKNRKDFLEGLEYLKLAKRVETIIYRKPWDWNPEPLDQQALELEKSTALEKYISVKSEFIRLRYAFQIVRLCYLTEKYDQGISFVKLDFNYTLLDGQMYLRTKGYEAACNVKLSNFSEANIWYAKLYDYEEAYKFEAFESFHPQSDKEWEETLLLAKSIREKELLWHLMGVYAAPLNGMKEIVKLNSTSDLLPLLLVRAVNIAENNLVENSDYRNNEYYPFADESNLASFTPDPLFSWNSIKEEQLDDLINTVERIAEVREYDKDVWLISAAYLNWIGGNSEKAMLNTDLALKVTKNNKAVLAQVAINKLLISFSEISEINDETENKIIDLINEVNQVSTGVKRDENAIQFVLRKMNKMYLAKGEELLAELCSPNTYNYYKNESDVRNMLAFMQNKDNNKLSKYLIGRYPLGTSDLYNILAVIKVYEYNFEAADSIYDKSVSLGTDELYGNPFNFRIKDCHDCDHGLPQKVKYTKRAFVDKMIELKNKAVTSVDPNEKANNYFLYANGLYNMTYYGNARFMSTTAIGNSMASSYYNCDKAEINYLKAMEHSKNKEFRAKCLWMAAKCQHNEWLEKEYVLRGESDFIAGEYFYMMKELFSDTKYYKEVIAECGYFCQFENPGLASCIKNP